MFKNYGDESCLPETLLQAIQLLVKCNFSQKVGEYESLFTKQQQFIISYVKQFETILLYTRATREKNFPLHLKATNALIKYFFAHDRLNYTFLFPVYLASMNRRLKVNGGVIGITQNKNAL